MNKALKGLVIIFVLAGTAVFGQQASEEITLRDIWGSGKFWQSNIHGVAWMNNGQYYTTQEEDVIEVHDITTGALVEELFDGGDHEVAGETFSFSSYTFNTDETSILLETGVERIYRHSTRADYYVFNRASKKLTQLSKEGKQRYASFSPDGEHVAYVRDNNLFYTTLSSGKETQITTDGEVNKIINGATDWVYEEEFAFARAFFWSPDSKRIAYYRFDESEVKEYNMQRWSDESLYPEDYKFKYPKAGEKNSEIQIHVYDLASAKGRILLDETDNDNYIPRVMWTTDPIVLSVRRLNRLQNHLELLHVNASTAEVKVVLEEKNDTYVDINDDLTYLKDGKGFIMSSEKDGFNHLYHYSIEGKLITQITQGDWEVSDFYGYSVENDMLYFTSTEESPLERYPYSITLEGKKKKKLVDTKGTNELNFSSDYSFFINYNSSITSPLTITLYQTSTTKQVRVMEDNARLSEYVAKNKLDAEFFSFTAPEGHDLNGWMIKPPGYSSAKKDKKKYPVLMFVYGGPGHQTVTNAWQSINFFWFQMLAQQGYVVVSVDNRGTGGRGAEFKKSTYGNLGKLELADQLSAANYLGSLPAIDKDRIGIWGWSYGGYMSSLAITLGADVFKMAIAVAPVTNWKFYDTIYTERYLKTPGENDEGYESFSPVNYAARLKGEYLLVHGTADDNVHLQNSIAMQNALISANKQFTSFFYPERNHGIYGGVTRYHLYNMMTNFILEKL